MAVGRANGNIEIYEWAVAEHAQDHILQAPQFSYYVDILVGESGSTCNNTSLSASPVGKFALCNIDSPQSCSARRSEVSHFSSETVAFGCH